MHNFFSTFFLFQHVNWEKLAGPAFAVLGAASEDENENGGGCRSNPGLAVLEHKRTLRNNFFALFYLFQYQPGKAHMKGSSIGVG